MGWTFRSGATRREIIDHLTRRQENESGIWETIAKACRGNVLWHVQRKTDKATGQETLFICCDLLSSQRGYGWGYKDMTESMAPCYYSCPLSFLDMVPCPGGQWAPAWRVKVREWHRQNSERRSMLKGARVGDVAVLRETCNPNRLTLTSVKPLLGRSPAGQLFKIPSTYVERIEAAAVSS